MTRDPRDLEAETARGLAAWNTSGARARAAYREEPNACTTWCSACVWPINGRNHCANCRHIVRERNRKKRQRKCPQCPRRIYKPKRLCDDCRESNKRATQRAYQQRRKNR